ncbi:hypothetical protein TL16_g04564 [Triparma laevis f. inornata]|uniref:Uncharacterized protein n=1 Tax=Triparma laevis f. inornata TaxID=1714386 RepID=A0A9W7E6J8_9STRA|nr:hypothetical protein TL16_g04564 [Triparma laevis f. inornata]
MDAQILKSLNISSNSVKTLRETVLVAEQCDPKDKASRKEFKTHMKKLETDGKIRISEDGIVSLAKEKRKGEGEEKGEKKAKKEKKEKKEKKSKKEKEDSTEPTADDDEPVVADATEEHPEADVSLTSPVPSAEKNKPCKGNRDGVTRLFLGNLPFKVDEQVRKKMETARSEATIIQYILY